MRRLERMTPKHGAKTTRDTSLARGEGEASLGRPRLSVPKRSTSGVRAAVRVSEARAPVPSRASGTMPKVVPDEEDATVVCPPSFGPEVLADDAETRALALQEETVLMRWPARRGEPRVDERATTPTPPLLWNLAIVAIAFSVTLVSIGIVWTVLSLAQH